MGPVYAKITGHGRYRLVETEKAGRLEGSGTDKLSRSRVNGYLSFSLADSGQNTTRLMLSLCYTLQGPLAQFARSSLAKEFVRLVVEDFRRNVSGELSGVSHKQPTGFSIGRLLRMIIPSLWRGAS